MKALEVLKNSPIVLCNFNFKNENKYNKIYVFFKQVLKSLFFIMSHFGMSEYIA